jgi:hypothetical protein
MTTQTAYSGDIGDPHPTGQPIDVSRQARFTGLRRILMITLASLLGWAIVLAPLFLSLG